jgi:hypothetical protein
MEPINVDIRRRIRFGELGAEQAASLFVEQTVNLSDQEPTLSGMFETAWNSLSRHIDPDKSNINIGVLRTQKETVWVESEGVRTPYSLSFELCYFSSNDRVMKAVWEYLPPAYPVRSEPKKDFRATDYFREKMIETDNAESLYSDIATSAYVYLKAASSELPISEYSY